VTSAHHHPAIVCACCMLAPALLGLGFSIFAAAACVAGSFAFTGSMHTGRDDHSAALVANGEMLVTGGEDNTGTTLAASSSTTRPPGPGPSRQA